MKIPIWIIVGFVVVGSIVFFTMYLNLEAEHYASCEKITITEVKDIDRALFKEDACIYGTTGGDRVLNCYYDVGDQICAN